MPTHTASARKAFDIAGRSVHPALIHAFGAVKLACCRANAELGYLTPQAADAIATAAREVAAGTHDAALALDALQGGAGTALNLAVSEVIAARAQELGGGDLDAIAHVNAHQSTNDTFPTALRIAAIRGARALDAALVQLQESLQALERRWADAVCVGRTELMDAVPLTMGRRFGAWAEAVNRDRWRVSKCEERLRVVNLGGTAIGTGMGAPRRYIFLVVERLRQDTGLNLARAENLIEATQNADVFTEVAGILGACATNLMKIAGDLRLLASGPHAGLAEITLPMLIAGSSIMPGKVNPVIPEAVTQAALRALGHQQVIAHACALGSLELNPFLPLIADALLDQIDLLTRSADALRTRCLDGLTVDTVRCRALLDASTTAVATALAGRIGYAAAAALAHDAATSNRTVGALAIERGLITVEELAALLTPANVLRLGDPDARTLGRSDARTPV